LTDAHRCIDEIDDAAGRRMHNRRSILLCPPVVVLGNRKKNRISPRPSRKSDTVLHDPSREMGVVGLSDELQAVTDKANDHERRSYNQEPERRNCV
jgi:hypothetical protein